MKRPFGSKVWVTQSQQTIGNVKIIFPEQQRQQPSKSVGHFAPVAVQRVHVNGRAPQRYQEEFVDADKETETATGRWVLNVIAAHEAYQQALKTNENHSQKKKSRFSSRKSSRIEPVENVSSQLMITPFHSTSTQYQDFDQFLHETMISPTTIDDDPTTPLSSFSSARSVDHIHTPGRSGIPLRTRANNQSDDCSTDQSKDSEESTCISKPVMILCAILSIVLIVGIIVAVFVTIFVSRNQSNSVSDKNLDPKSLSDSLFTIYDMICPTELFDVIDPICVGEMPYQYHSCYQMATSTALTIRFAFQHDTISGHWYLDDISAVQNANFSLILNGGFEYNLTGWLVSTSANLTAETYVDTITGLAHTGSAYLHGASKNDFVYIEQTFNVTVGEYINISFWWGYDGGVKTGDTCRAIGQLIPSF